MLEKWIVKAVPEVVTDWSIVGTENTKEEALALARRLDRKYLGAREMQIFRWCFILGLGWRYIASDTIYYQKRKFKKKAGNKKKSEKRGAPLEGPYPEDLRMAVASC